MPALDRSYWFAVALASYVSVAGVQHAGFGAWRVAQLLLGPVALLAVWRSTRRGMLSLSVEGSVLRAARIAATCALLWLNAASGGTDDPFLQLVSTAAVGACAVAAAYALARIASVPGLVSPPRSARSLDAAAFAGFLWGAALVVSGVRFVAPDAAPRLDPLTLNYTVTAASIGSLLVLIAMSWRVRVLRQLEMGVSDRAEGAVAITVSALSVAVPAAAVNIAAPDQVLPAASIVASLGVLWTVLARDPAHVASVLRGTVAVMLLGVPTTLIIGAFTRRFPDQATALVLAGSVLSIFTGLIARNVARPLGPEQSRWLLAISEANQNALLPEPGQAMVATLAALKKVSKSPVAAPQLWRLSPASRLTVDVAGYLHEGPAQVPERLCDLALAEPERTLRVDTLKALEVQRPLTRPLLAWFEAREAFCVTLIVDDDGPLGFLLLPRGERTQQLTLEEARALRILADRISALLSITATLARSRERETQLIKRADLAESRLDETRRVLTGQSVRERELARALARPLLGTAYSPAARVGLADIEHQTQQGGPVLLLAPIGTDVTAWAAAAHLKGKGSAGPFLVVDAAAETHADTGRWANPNISPWQLARGGTLFIRDLQLLPLKDQADLLEAITAPEAQAASLPAPVLIASLGLQSPHSLTSGEALAHLPRRLAPLFKLPALELPALVERPEDLRSLVLEALRRHQSHAEALGIERHALQVLMDHTWPGNERELYDVVERAAQVCRGPVLTLAHLHEVGFARPAAAPIADELLELAQNASVARALPPTARRRPRSHRPRPRG